MRIRKSGWVCCVLAAAASPWARGSFEMTGPGAVVSIPAAGGWSIVATQSFSALAWVRPEQVGGVERGVLDVEGSLSFVIDASGALRATLLGTGGASPELSATAPGALPEGEWSLVCATFSVSSDRLTLRVVNSAGLHEAQAADPGFSPSAPTGDAVIGASGGRASMVGTFGAAALRVETLTSADAESLWSERWFSGIYAAVTTGSGGALTGEDGCRWMTGHTMVTDPNNGIDEDLDPHLLAAVIGEPVTTLNVATLDRSAAISPTNVAVVRPVSVASGAVHVSPFDADAAGHFRAQIVVPTAADYPEEDIIPSPAPKARRLVTGAVGPMRVMTSANSRGVRSDDGSGRPGNFAHGFFAAMSDRVCGVLNRPASTGPAPWFGFDCTENGAYAAGNVLDLTDYDFARFWSGSAKQAGTGPGRGLLLRPESVFALRTRPEGLMLAEAPLEFEVYVLRYPGAGIVRWTPSKSAAQGEEGEAVGASQELDLDSTAWTHGYDSALDAYNPSLGRLTLDGDCTGELEVGWAAHVDRRLSVIASMDYGVTTPGKTTLALEHRFGSGPETGEVIEFGPWRYETLTTSAPALAAGDPMVWRGVSVESIAPDRNVVLFSLTAWRPGVDGFLFGTSGWGGKGYGPQLEESFSQAPSEWVRTLRPDIWLQMFAQQNSPTATMGQYTNMIREGAPEADIVWMGDVAHFNTLELWHRYILQNAASQGLPAMSFLRDPRTGTILDQFAAGTRSDTSHLNYLGNTRLAMMWLEAMETAIPATGGPADIDGDGDVDFADLNYLLDHWLETGSPLAADLNSDGVVNFQDLNMLLGVFNGS